MAAVKQRPFVFWWEDEMQTVHVVIDRPLGSRHPRHAHVIYGVNYGYVPGVMAADGEAQDAYVLGVDHPLDTFDGELIAVIRRKNDVEDKWVVAPKGMRFSKTEIASATAFVEQYFESEIEMMEEAFVFLPTDDLQDGEIMLRLHETKPAVPEKGYVPAYTFDICLISGEKVGACDLRVGHTQGLYYGGNIGYAVDAPHRGHHYAAKACKLLFKLAQKHGMGYVYITCNPDNVASAKTCEYAGASYEGTVDLPEDNDMYRRGERQVRVYRVDMR